MHARFSVVGSVCVLGLRLLGGTVGEVFELLLVDLSDDGLVCGRQNGILLGEVLVKVIHISLGLLQTHTHTQGKDVSGEPSLSRRAEKELQRHLVSTYGHKVLTCYCASISSTVVPYMELITYLWLKITVFQLH